MKFSTHLKVRLNVICKNEFSIFKPQGNRSILELCSQPSPRPGCPKWHKVALIGLKSKTVVLRPAPWLLRYLEFTGMWAFARTMSWETCLHPRGYLYLFPSQFEEDQTCEQCLWTTVLLWLHCTSPFWLVETSLHQWGTGAWDKLHKPPSKSKQACSNQEVWLRGSDLAFVGWLMMDWGWALKHRHFREVAKSLYPWGIISLRGRKPLIEENNEYSSDSILSLTATGVVDMQEVRISLFMLLKSH